MALMVSYQDPDLNWLALTDHSSRAELCGLNTVYVCLGAESIIHPGEGVWCLNPARGRVRTRGKSHCKGRMGGTGRERAMYGKWVWVAGKAPHRTHLLEGTNDYQDNCGKVLAVTFSVSKFQSISDPFSCYFATVGTVIQISPTHWCNGWHTWLCSNLPLTHNSLA